MPRWAYRRLVHTGGGNPNVVMMADGEARTGQPQLTDYLLCSPCEQRVGRWEAYVAGVALQTSDRFPALDAATVEVDIPNMKVLNLSALDVAQLVRFAASVFWRASISFRLPRVSLGAYEEPFREFLLGTALDFPQAARLTVHLVRPTDGTRLDRVVALPYSGREDGYRVHRFAVFGFLFGMFVGGKLPELIDELCVVRTNRAVVNGDAMLRPGITEAFQRVRAVGALARRGVARR